MAIAINCLESQVYEKLPSQPKLNLKNVSAMTFRSEKEIQESELATPKIRMRKKSRKNLRRRTEIVKI